MTYKIFCSDLDGTLLSTKRDVSDFTISEIQRIKPTTKIILVSARMPKAMRHIQRDLGIEKEPIICYNGALILDNDKEVYSTFIETATILSLFELTKTYDIKLGLYYKDEWYVEEISERVSKEIHHTKATPIYRNTNDTIIDLQERNIGAHKIMLMGTLETIDSITPHLESKFTSEMNIYRSNDTLIEVTPKAISKLSAIETLLNGNDTLKDVIAFGDNYNDDGMLRHADCGVAVGNARDEVKAIADYITLKNTENGVAHFLNLHFKI
jgi:Cof subfamily protein (haloacid dehalogenase superfamily)